MFGGEIKLRYEQNAMVENSIFLSYWNDEFLKAQGRTIDILI